jgi:hypothetical protein
MSKVTHTHSLDYGMDGRVFEFRYGQKIFVRPETSNGYRGSFQGERQPVTDAYYLTSV